MNAVFCIKCGRMTHMETGELVGHEVHVVIYGDNAVVEGVDVDFCNYPDGFAFCPPPEVGEDWIDFVVEPGVFLPDQYSQYDIELELSLLAEV